MKLKMQLRVVMYNTKFPLGIVLDQGLTFLLRCPMSNKSIVEATIGFFSLVVC